jgi:hypothetical protein
MIMRLTFVYITENSTATISVLPETTKVTLTLIFSLIPILFSESYLYTLSFVPFADIDLRILILSILGTIIAILLACKAKRSIDRMVISILTNQR